MKFRRILRGTKQSAKRFRGAVGAAIGGLEAEDELGSGVEVLLELGELVYLGQDEEGVVLGGGRLEAVGDLDALLLHDVEDEGVEIVVVCREGDLDGGAEEGVVEGDGSIAVLQIHEEDFVRGEDAGLLEWRGYGAVAVQEACERGFDDLDGDVEGLGRLRFAGELLEKVVDDVDGVVGLGLLLDGAVGVDDDRLGSKSVIPFVSPFFPLWISTQMAFPLVHVSETASEVISPLEVLRRLDVLRLTLALIWLDRLGS